MTMTTRIYIGNLPHIKDLKMKLVDFLNKRTTTAVDVDDWNVQVSDISMVPRREGGAAAAFVSCPTTSVQEQAIALLDGTKFEGNTLVVQPQRRKQQLRRSNKRQSFFGGSGWTRPSSSSGGESHRQAGKTEDTPTNTDNESRLEFSDELELSLHLGSIVAGELLQEAKDDESSDYHGDIVNTMIASTAAMTLLSSVDAFGLERHNNNPTCPVKDPTVSHRVCDGSHEATKGCDVFTSPRTTKKSLSELMADYGEQDMDFQKKVVPIAQRESNKKKNMKRGDYNNRLTLKGKAPIHVDVVSFGYVHGVPSDVRSSGGWSRSHPLPPFDCRDLSQVPHYMTRQDGLSPAVKRVVLNGPRPRIEDNVDENTSTTGQDYSARACAQDIGKQVLDALYEAITVGNYGHASPLLMTIYVGSEAGRHRSVVVCEQAATELRKLLRSNEKNRITQPVSVGTSHRDIERRQQQQQQRDVKRRRKGKQIEFESEW